MRNFPEKVKTKTKTPNVIPFEQDSGFYLKKGVSYYRKNKPEKALFYFQKAVSVEPNNAFNHYNLACMLSKMGQLREANRIFLHILQHLDEGMTECYFLLAINYGLLGEMELSQYYLKQYLSAEPFGELAYEASELLSALEDYAEDTYSERDFYMETVLTNSEMEELCLLYDRSPEFRRGLRIWLYDGPDEYKEKILDLYDRVGGDKAKRVLRKFVKNPWIKERFRQLALLALKKMGEEQVKIYAEGKLVKIKLNQLSLPNPVWRQEWQQVIDCTIRNMQKSNCYDDGFFEDVQAIWLDYINTVYPDTPRIVKVQAWAAALEYSLARFHFLDLTQKELAAEYGVSCTSISGNFKRINEALHLEEKAFQNMLAFFKRELE
ncbi:MAG: tetratricopeptide repeat protein [Firmicutes bacterium]|mgnify:FL=1|nr:tetratricopeptide repeat protein [Bacillota bacterium]